jgi:mannose-6-phosphate isomerase-like protein (cupin superfamily)
MVDTSSAYAAGQNAIRPWGEWAVLDVGHGYVVKRIRVRPGGILSLQRHRHRAEDWTVVAGTGRVTLGERQFDLAMGGSTHIGLGELHRIANTGTDDVVFIEVQTGAYLSEDDIERSEDSYGRR